MFYDSSQKNNNDTIAAIATPNGVGAIATIRLSGPKAIQIASSIFKPKKQKLQLSEAKSHHVYFGKIYDEDRLIDEVLLTLFKAPELLHWRGFHRNFMSWIFLHSASYFRTSYK